jgi:ribokinase
VGGPSLDTLDGTDRLVAGGAGMYTAMACRRSGADVSIFAPRPQPMPEALQEVAANIEWLGPVVGEQDMARFEIRYANDRTTYVQAHFGAEEDLSPTELPTDLSGYDCVHLIPLGNIRRQHEFMLACRDRGARKISAGTALDLINAQPEDAQAVLAAADVFFMNQEEALRLFGSMDAVRARPGQTLFITQGADGATVVQGDLATRIHGVPASVVDPTGAGDTFCGATLVAIAAGRHPVMAARQAMPLAAGMTEKVGPAVLMRKAPPPQYPPDDRVLVNDARVGEIARLIADVPQMLPFDFTGPDLPAVGHPATIDYFFVSTLQQFGFWTTRGGRYEGPLVASLDGEERKGAFYLFRAFLRWLETDPQKLTPAGQAELGEDELLAVLRADDGADPMPALEMHLALARRYGRDLCDLGLTPQDMLAAANASPCPPRTLLRLLDQVGGYKEDPLRKKSALLAMILQQRPERFLGGSADDVPPVIDYHVMRSCLRIGLIDVTDGKLAARLAERRLLAQDEEWAVRAAAYAAIEALVRESGRTVGAVDWFFFQARSRCPEMSEPLCGECAVDPACAHRKELFQPVYRTSFY